MRSFRPWPGVLCRPPLHQRQFRASVAQMWPVFPSITSIGSFCPRRKPGCCLTPPCFHCIPPLLLSPLPFSQPRLLREFLPLAFSPDSSHFRCISAHFHILLGTCSLQPSSQAGFSRKPSGHLLTTCHASWEECWGLVTFPSAARHI